MYFTDKMIRRILLRINTWRVPSRIIFIITGIISTVWFLIRVIPKPSRAAYPCIRTSAPLMSAFIIYLLSISTSVLFFKKFRIRLLALKYLPAIGFFLVAIFFMFFSGLINNQPTNAIQHTVKGTYTANDPQGIAKGINPGRVVWIWDPDATDETCICLADSGDYWFENTDAAVVEKMLSHGIMSFAGESTPFGAWDAIFRYFNSNHNKGNVGYTDGEKIYIKINITNSCCSVNDNYIKTKDFERMDATPELVLALLKQLIEIVGVKQSDIYLGDPFRKFHNLYWNMCHSVYPEVNYCDGHGFNGRHKTIPTTSDAIFFSDGVNAWRIPQEYVDAEYFINMPCLKSHESGGITIAAKNHQGSVLQDGGPTDDQSAYGMHYCLPDQNPTPDSYRHLVDYMGHEHLGGKTLLVIVDGIWAGRNWEGYVEKWQMAPFNDDYPSSLYISQDLVAIESVCWDFLLTEYENKPAEQKYPYMSGVEDYIKQSADPVNWPAGITYDPEGDGTELGSLGVYEHWNNATDKQYTRNLGTGDGIELVQELQPVYNSIHISHQAFSRDIISYPNPAKDLVFLEYSLATPGYTLIEIFSDTGEKVGIVRAGIEYTGSQQLIWNVSQLVPGTYLFRLMHIGSNEETSIRVKKFMVK